MPEETATQTPPTTEDQAPSAPQPAGESGESSGGNEWLRETAQGLIYSRPLDTAKRSQEYAEANAELRRGRRNKREESEAPSEEGGSKPEEGQQDGKEPPPSGREPDDQEFQRRVQAEVDRREAMRRQRTETVRERELRQRDPQAYARLKAQQEQQSTQAAGLSRALSTIATEFDDATVTPLMRALPDDDARNAVLKDAGHGIPGRKEIVSRAIEALKKSSYDEGFAKGKESANRSLRRSRTFRDELLSEMRGGEDEPEVALANGSVGDNGFDMNDFMRGALGKRTRASNSRE